MRRTGTRLLEVRDFLRVKLDDLWLPVQKSSTSVRQRSGRCWHPARASTGCEQNGGNLTQLSHKLQPCLVVYKAWKFQIFISTTAAVTRFESFFQRWGHLTWPDDLTLDDLDLQFSGKLRNSCPNSYAKKTMALHGSVKAHYWEQKNVQSIPKQHGRKCGKHEETWHVEASVLFPEVIKSHPIQ